MLSLGIDISTQSATGVVLEITDEKITVKHHCSIPFSDLPQYNAPQGFLHNDNPLIREAPPLLWIDSLRHLLVRIASEGCDMSQISVISGSAQQHGSLYLNEDFLTDFDKWGSSEVKPETFEKYFTREKSPIWMDSSTSDECREIAESAGGDENVRKISGSYATERFTGPQIRKFSKGSPPLYRATARIHLVSSFFCSLFAGKDGPTEIGDGSGMNLMDISREKWDETLCTSTAPDLISKLPKISERNAIVGKISRGMQRQFGFSDSAEIVVWTGDNPSAIVGLGAVRSEDAVLSLGTSDTCLSVADELNLASEAAQHCLGHPAGGFMKMTCVKNGSLARETVRDAAGVDWKGFSSALSSSSPGNDGFLMLPIFVPEITPKILQPRWVKIPPSDESEWTREKLCRGVVEAQAMCFKAFAFNSQTRVSNLIAAGGAAVNSEILQVFSDVLGVKISALSIAAIAPAVGAALRAANALDPKAFSWESLREKLQKSQTSSQVEPKKDCNNYDELYRKYRAALRDEFGVDTA